MFRLPNQLGLVYHSPVCVTKTGGEQGNGVAVLAFVHEDEVEVRPLCEASLADLPDRISAGDRLSRHHQVA